MAYENFVTQPYILADLTYTEDVSGIPVLILPNEVSLLKDKQLSPELKERLGMVFSALPHSENADNVSRYNQGLSEVHDRAIAALDALPDNVEDPTE